MKNIVLCLDGTSNSFALRRTNVVKLASLLVQDEARQVVFYNPGVGTMPAPGAMTWIGRKVTTFFGLAFGAGLTDDIRDAFVFLMNNYEVGDRVFIFGFSRGAYTARAVASLLHMYGLIGRGNEPLVPYAIRLMTDFMKVRGTKDADAYFETAREFKATFSARPCDPHFVGVWDTVSSVGWLANPLRLPFTGGNPSIAIGRHAIAIDERRAFFRTNLWRGWRGKPPAGPVDMKQVWFAGVHCDVGGGYEEERSGLAAIALDWMVREAEAAGLLFDEACRAHFLPRYAAADPTAALNDSMRWFWWPLEYLPRRYYDRRRERWSWRFNAGRRRSIPADAVIHRSAWDRGPEYRAAASMPLYPVIED